MWPQLQEGRISKRAKDADIRSSNAFVFLPWETVWTWSPLRGRPEAWPGRRSCRLWSSGWGEGRGEGSWSSGFYLKRRGGRTPGRDTWQLHSSSRGEPSADRLEGENKEKGTNERKHNKWNREGEKIEGEKGRYNQRHRLQHLAAVWDKHWELVDQWAGIRGARGEQAGLLITYQCEYDTLQYTGARPGSRTRHNCCTQRKETEGEDFMAMALSENDRLNSTGSDLDVCVYQNNTLFSHYIMTERQSFTSSFKLLRMLSAILTFTHTFKRRCHTRVTSQSIFKTLTVSHF